MADKKISFDRPTWVSYHEFPTLFPQEFPNVLETVDGATPRDWLLVDAHAEIPTPIWVVAYGQAGKPNPIRLAGYLAYMERKQKGSPQAPVMEAADYVQRLIGFLEDLSLHGSGMIQSRATWLLQRFDAFVSVPEKD